MKTFCLLILSFAISASNLQAAQGDIQLREVPRQTSVPAPLETQTRGFYNSLQDSFKFVSPDNAMLVLAETLANVRFKGRYGSQSPQFLCHYQITNPSEGHQPTSTIDCPQDQTSTIVQHFFPSPAGGILRMPALDKIDLIARMDINATGELLKIYVLYTTHMAEAKIVPQIEQVREEYFQAFEEFFKKRIESLAGDTRAYKILSEQWQKASMELNQLPKLYATMFTDAFEERSHYPAHLVEYTLLAYAWKKASKREQLINLINGALQGFKKPTDPQQPKKKISPFSEKLYWQWKQEAVKNNKLIPIEFQEWINDPEKLTFMTIGYHLFENPYPKILDFGIAVYNHSTGNMSFTDCGETSLRNFLNFMICNFANKSFDSNILLKAFPHIREAVITFYKDIQPLYSNVLGIGKDRSAWANSISGLDPQKVIYGEKVCSISGVGIDNILSVLEEILGDEELKNIALEDKAENRAEKLQYIIDKFNEARPDIQVSWSENGQSDKITAFPIITFMVNSVPVFEWTFQSGHFTFLPIADENVNTNWLLNSTTGVETILHAPLPDDLKRLLLPFYMGDVTMKSYLSNQEKQQEIRGYAYEFLFGSPMRGSEQILKSLDIALSLNSEAPSLKDLAKTLIRKSFVIPDAAGDRMLVGFLFRHKDVFGDLISQEIGERVANLYTETVNNFKPNAIQSNTKNAEKGLEKLFETPFASNLILYAINNWPKELMLSSKFSLGMTILHLASKTGHLSVVKTLLKDEQARQILLSQENIKDAGVGRTPLHLASWTGRLLVVEALLKDKQARQILLSPENIKDMNDRTPLHLASEGGHLSVVKALLKDEQARQILLNPENFKDRNGKTPLHLASDAGRLSVVEALLKDEQARPLLLNLENIKDRNGKTPLHLASDAGRLSVVEALLKDEQARPLLLNLENIKDKNDKTPLHFASEGGHLSVVKALLKDEQARQILLNQENIKDKNGKTPLHLASSAGHLSVVEALLKDEQARPLLLNLENIKDRNGTTPLHLASSADHLPVVKTLLKDEQARPLLLSQENIKDKNGKTPLHLASSAGYLSVVEALLKDEQARPLLLNLENIKDRNGKTPLHLASRAGRLPVVEALLKDEQVRQILLSVE